VQAAALSPSISTSSFLLALALLTRIDNPSQIAADELHHASQHPLATFLERHPSTGGFHLNRFTMATKTVPVGSFGKMHTAGIFSDMTVDGPNIGTLVVIMDRAKNLPNRRSMGKQDPYCAARLGKEAKKTNTDKRGGQTPRW
jgi:hypothetical protein